MDKFIDNKIVTISHSKKSVKLVFNAIKELNTQVKVRDIVIKTGLSVHNVEDALEELLKKYPCRFHADIDGNLLYDFTLKKDKKSLLKKVVKGIRNIFKYTFEYSYKAWIAFMLIGYFLFYVPAITYYFFPTALAYLGAGLAILFIVILLPATIIFFGIFYPLIHKFIYNENREKKKKTYKEYKPAKLKGFFSGDRLFFTDRVKFNWNIIKTVFNYVFGGQLYYKSDKLNLEKKILAYINSNNKRITVTELIAITGWDIIKAETEMTKIFVQYHGKVYVTEDGAIIYYFPEIESQQVSEIDSNPFIWKTPFKRIGIEISPLKII